MPIFSKISAEKLATCDERLQRLMHEVVRFVDCSIICGHRNQADQDKAYKEGKSKLLWPKSKHNAYPSLAVDVVPFPIDWHDIPKFISFVNYVKSVAHSMGIAIRCGADFETLKDYPHFELID